MKTPTIALNFSGLNAQDIALRGETVYNNLIGNVNFTSCAAYLPTLTTEVAALKAAIIIAKDEGTKAETSAVYDAEKKVKRVLKVISAVITFEAAGNETKLLTSGFELRAYTPPTPKSFNAKQGKLSGTVDLEINSYGAAAYAWEISADPISTWNPIALSTVSKTTVTGLTPGIKYWFRVSVTKGNAKLATSDPYFIIVV